MSSFQTIPPDTRRALEALGATKATRVYYACNVRGEPFDIETALFRLHTCSGDPQLEEHLHGRSTYEISPPTADDRKAIILCMLVSVDRIKRFTLRKLSQDAELQARANSPRFRYSGKILHELQFTTPKAAEVLIAKEAYYKELLWLAGQ